MLVLSATVRKVDPKDERFPGWDALKRPDGSIMGFCDLYLCEVKTDTGEQECPFFLTDGLIAEHGRQAALAMMFELFAKEVRKMGQVEAAA